MEDSTVLVALLVLIGMYVVYAHFLKRSKHALISYEGVPLMRGTVAMSADDKELLGVVPVQRIRPPSVQTAKVGFPLSPVMPDLNVIDGVAPFNPDIVGKEWGAALESGDTRPGKIERVVRP